VDQRRGGRRQGLTRARPNGRSFAWWLTDDGAMENGARGESVSALTGVRATVWRPGNASEESAVVALGAGSAWAWEEEK
jgi:hypothetical protein